MSQSALYKAALKMLQQNLALKKGETVTVVTDRKKCRIFEAVCKAVELKRGKLEKIRITRNRRHSEQLPALKKVFAESDVIIAITDKSVSHCPETRIARKEFGTRVISMVEVGEKLFLKAIKANQKKIKAIGKRLAKKMKRAKKIRITTPSGTNILARVIKQMVKIDDGDSTKRGELNNLPFGEVGIAPINIVDGVIAIDFSRVGIRTKDLAKLIVKKGKIIGWNEKAGKLVKYLRKADGECALRVVELAFGTNPAHKKLVGKIIHDEKILGSAHIAFGGWGNARKCKVHEDIIMLKPTVFFDNKVVIKKGGIL